MLVLDRKIGERILIGDDYILTLVSASLGDIEIEVSHVDSEDTDSSVISRKLHKMRCRDNVSITDEIKFAVIEINHVEDYVAIGVKAPREVPIHREEINKQILKTSSKDGRKPCGRCKEPCSS